MTPRDDIDTTGSDLDAVHIEVIRNALAAVAEEMSVTIWRTSRSAVVREILDYSTCVFDAYGHSVAQAKCMPVHLNSMPSCLDEILKNYIPLDQWEEGDLVVTNDPYAGGQHLPDILTFKPVFLDGVRIGIVGILVHHLDVGGGAAGSYDPGATDIYQEGFRIPPLKLDEKGKRNQAVIKLLLRNSREPANVGGDFSSQLAALDTGVKGLQRIGRRYGVERLQTAAERIQDQSEAALRAMIASLPDGEYRFHDFVDDDGIELDRPLRIEVTAKVRGDSIHLDFAGSDPQARGPINCTLNMTRSAAMCGVMMGLGNDVPANEGCYRPITIDASAGTIVNANWPAPVANRMATGHRVVTTVLGALAKAAPDRIPAAYYGVSYAYAVNCEKEDGARSVYFDLECGGWGAHPEEDGASAFSCGFHNISNAPVEMLESTLPVTFTEYGLAEGTGGQGRTRGGLGLVREFRLDAAKGTLAANFERFKHAPYGLAGGEPGRPGRFTLIRESGKTVDLASKVAGLALNKGDRLRLQTSGGGGHGDPAERDPARCAHDRQEGYMP
ncbi:hydantoinase B/oxoprolinase family protein [Hwanghaeella sp.]|uniref:hydantoinase B/oxoprolinase family protein n=1 Tax=Hwanghaeella sp. TaxID=2605943 RepID=UPI003CCBF09E